MTMLLIALLAIDPAPTVTTADVMNHPAGQWGLTLTFISSFFGLIATVVSSRTNVRVVKLETENDGLKTSLAKCETGHKESKEEREKMAKEIDKLKDATRKLEDERDEEHRAKRDALNQLAPFAQRVVILEKLLKKYVPEAALYIATYEHNALPNTDDPPAKSE